MTAEEARLWFIAKRFELYDLLNEEMSKTDNWEQGAKALMEHDLALHQLAKKAQRLIARADFVTVLTRRANS